MPTTDDQRDPAVAAAPVTDPDATVPDSDPQPAGRRKRSWRQLMMVVVAAIVLMLLIKAFVVQVYRIPSSSMEDTLPGDHVVCCVNGKVTVNGAPLGETSYLFPGARPSMQPFNVIVPPGRLWVMGDNRAISDDSRGHMSAGFPAMGTIPENEVCGRAFMIIWPPSQIGDLPIPATFQQAAWHAKAAAAAG